MLWVCIGGILILILAAREGQAHKARMAKMSPEEQGDYESRDAW